MIKAAVFDMDGTITNTLPTITNVVNTIMAENSLAPYTENDVMFMVGNGYKNLLRLCFEKRGGDMSALASACDRYMQLYGADFLTGSYVYDGIIPALEKLKSKGIKLAVLSNRPHVQTVQVINALFGEGFFDELCGAVDEFPLKPDTTQLKNILKKFDVLPEETLYFGDTATDMKTGKGGGIYTIGVLWGFRPKEELSLGGADEIIDLPSDIEKFAD